MAANEIDSIYISVELDKRKLDRQLDELKKEKLSISVDDSELTELNKHLDRKLRHLQQVRQEFAKGIKVNVDDSQLDELSKKLSDLSGEDINLGTKGDVGKKIADEINQGLKSSSNTIFKTISAPFRDLATGFFQEIGGTFGRQVGGGLSSGIKKAFDVDLKKSTESAFKDFKSKKPPESRQEIKIPFNEQQRQRVADPVAVGFTKTQVKVKVEGIEVTAGKRSFRVKFDPEILKEKIQESVKNVQNEVEKSSPNIDQIKSDFQSIRGHFKEAYAKMREAIKDNNLELAKAYGETIASASERAKADIDRIKDEAKRQGHSGSFGSELATIAGSSKGVIERNYAKPAARDVAKIKNLESVANDAKIVGSQTISGVVEGLKGSSPVRHQASVVALSIIDQMRKDLGIQSPSKKAMQVMSQVIQGLVQGAKSGVNLVTEPIKNVSGQILSSIGLGQKPKTQAQQAAEESKKYFNNLYDEFGKKFVEYAKKSLGDKGEDVGGDVAGMLFSGAMGLFPGATGAAVGLAPFAIPTLPIATAIGAVSGILTPLIATVKTALTEIQPIQTRLNNLTGSQAGGQAELQYLQSVSGRTSTSIRAGSDAYSQLAFATRGTKLEGEETKKLYEGISVAAKAVGADTYGTSLIFNAFTQMVAKGKISMEELRQQLSEKFPAAMQVFAKAMGVSVPQLTSLISKGAVLSEDILPKVSKVLLEDFASANASGTTFATTLTKIDNAMFDFQVNMVNKFGGVVTGVSDIWAGLIELFNQNFDTISKIVTTALIGFTAQIGVGISAIMSIPKVAGIFTNIQTGLLTAWTRSFKLLTPFFAGILVDMLSDVFGTKNDVMDNIMGAVKGLSDMIQNFQNLGRTDSDGGGIGAMFASISNSIGSLINIVPKGTIELLALILAFEQMKVLGAMTIVPMFKSIGGTLFELGAGIKRAVTSAKSLGDMFKAIVPAAANAANALAGLKGFAIEAALALFVMALGKSDFSNPLAENFNKASTKIKSSIKEISKELETLKSVGKDVGNSMKQSLELSSKGLELNIKRIIGLEEDSYKSDDLIKDLNKNPVLGFLSKLSVASVFSGDFMNPDIFDKGKVQRRKTEAEALGIGEYFTGTEKNNTIAQQQLLRQAKDISEQRKVITESLRASNLTPDRVEIFAKSDLAKTVNNLDTIDAKIKDLSSKRVELGLINTSDSKIKIAEIDKQINGLLAKRKTEQKPLDSILGNVDEIKSKLAEQEKAIDDANLPNAAKRQLKSLLDPQKQMVDETIKYLKANRLYDLIKPLEDIWTRVINRLTDANAAFDKFTAQSKIAQLNTTESIYNKGNNEAVTRRNLDTANIENLITQQSASKTILAERQKSLKELLAISGVENTDDKAKQIKELRESIAKEQLSVAEYGSQIAQARHAMQRQIIEQTKQVSDYFNSIVRQLRESRIEFEKQVSSINSLKAQNKIRSAMLGVEENIVTQFADALVANIESLNNIKQQELDARVSQLKAISQIEDSRRGAFDVLKSLPIELPPIPVELDLSKLQDDSNVEGLREGFEDVQTAIDNGGNSLYDMQSSVDAAANLVKSDLTNSIIDADSETRNLTSSIDAANTPTSTLLQTFQDTLRTTENTGGAIQQNTDKTIAWQAPLSVVTEQTKGINEQAATTKNWFQSIWETITGLVQKTMEWFQSLTNIQAISQNIQGFFGGLGQGIQNAVGTVQGMLGGGQQATVSGGGGIASPLIGQSLEALVAYRPSAQQGFFGIRDGGRRRHSKVDFDSRVGGGQGAGVAAAMSGMATWRPISSNSAGINIETTDPQGRPVTVVYNHISLAEVKKLFGGSKSMQVTAGQRIGSVTMDSLSTGAHLDWGIKINGQYVDPQKYIRDVMIPASKRPQARTGGTSSGGGAGGSWGAAPQSGNQGGVLWGHAARYSPSDLSGLTPRGRKAMEALRNPHVRAFLDAVAIAELDTSGADKGGYGYFIGDTGGKETFNPNTLTAHPRRIRHNSSATGRYQTMNFVWDEEAPRLGLRDMKPQSQEIMAVSRLMMRKILPDIMAGNVTPNLLSGRGFYDASNEWASIQGNPYGQGTRGGKQSTFLANYRRFLQQYQSGGQSQNFAKSDLANSPQQYKAIQFTVSPAQAIQGARIPPKFISPSGTSPQSLQRATVAAGNAQVESIQRQNELEQKRKQQELERERIEYQRKQEQALRTYRRGRRDATDEALGSARNLTDLRYGATGIKDPNEEFQMRVTKIVREYDDAVRDRERKLEQIDGRIDAAKKLLPQLTQGSKEKTEVEKGLADDIKIRESMRQELEKVKATRGIAVADAKKLFDREQFLRSQSEMFTKVNNDIQSARTRLEGLKQLQAINPLASEVKEIPNLEKLLSIRESDLELQRQIADIEEKVFNKKMTRDVADREIQQLAKINDEKIKNIELTYRQAEAERKQTEEQRSLNRRSSQLENENSLIEEQLKLLELRSRFNPELKSEQEFDLQRASQLRSLQLDKDKKSFEIRYDKNLSEEERQTEIDRLEKLFQARVNTIEATIDANRREFAVNQLETQVGRAQKMSDFIQQPEINRANARIALEESMGGNQFQINARKRSVGIQQENLRYAQEMQQMNATIERMKLEGFDITDEQVARIKQNLADINQFNLQNINQQFKTFGGTLNEIVSGSFKGLAQSLTDLILKGGSLTDVLDNLVNNILSGVLNAGLSSLFGGMFGGMGGIFGGMFASGGTIGGAFDKERRESGRKPYLIVAHEGEFLIPHSRISQLEAQGITKNQLLGYSNGGEVGRPSRPTGKVSQSNKNGSIRVETIRINSQEYVTTDQMQMAMEQAIAMGGNKGVELVQNRLQNDSGFRGSVGL